MRTELPTKAYAFVNFETEEIRCQAYDFETCFKAYYLEYGRSGSDGFMPAVGEKAPDTWNWRPMAPGYFMDMARFWGPPSTWNCYVHRGEDGQLTLCPGKPPRWWERLAVKLGLAKWDIGPTRRF